MRSTLAETGKKRVLYHAVSSYQLLEMMLHRQIFHKKDWAAVILPDFIREKYPRYRRLKSPGLFDAVCLFPYLQIPHREESMVTADVVHSYETAVGWNIHQFDAVYVAGAHFYFSLYLIWKQVPFYFFEDAAGMLSRPGILYEALLKTFPVHARLAWKYGLFNGDHPLVKKIYCLKSAQEALADGREYENFSVEEALMMLPEGDRKRVIRFFLKHPIRIKGDGILMTQNFAGLGIMTAGEQQELYEGLKGILPETWRWIIKKHPDDKMDYGTIFPKAKILRPVFPAELLPYVFRKCPPVIYTFDSTGCENLSRHFQIIKIRRQGGCQSV